MIRDVFYYGSKPNVHPREKHATSLSHARNQCTTAHFWIINEFCDYTNFDWEFDFEFLPDEDVWAENHNNVWPSTHQKDSGTWLCSKSESEIIIYRADVDPIKRKDEISNNWIVPENVDTSTFDFSWHPDSTSPPYIYQFGTLLNNSDGPRYITPDNNGETVFKYRIYKDGIKVDPILVNKYCIETTLDDLVRQHPDEVFWALCKQIDYTKFNFDWRPDLRDIDYVQVFGSPASSKQTFFVNARSYLNGNNQLKFIEPIQPTTQPDMFFVDRGNINSQENYEKLKLVYPNLQKTRYLNSWVDTVYRCINRSTTELCWILNSELDYTDFDFNYYPNPWQMKMIHVFGTQWSHWGSTYLINRETFANDTKYVKTIEHLSNLNFVKERRAVANTCIYDIYVIDHGNKETGNIVELLKTKSSGRNVNVVQYVDSYLKTINILLKSLPDTKEQYIWICNSICDYSTFDFSYICDPFAKEQLHVFPSDGQRYGDTFLVNVNKLKELVDSLTNLEEYTKINFNQHQRVKRLTAPYIVHDQDTHVETVLKQTFDFPYATFVTVDNKNIKSNEETISLWSEESKTILVTSTGGSRIIVPKEAKNYVNTQLYDYPYIKTSSKLVESKPLDIIFLSNGERCADENYLHLLKLVKGRKNTVVRIDKIDGRVRAYHAAAYQSNTPWLFTVFAKLKVDENFDWNWQPDRLQIPKHYIFHAQNPVNGLVYGHQAMIAYNKKLTLDNPGLGLDFTLDSPHEVVDMLSGVATYNTDPYSTWRTAFREAIKLRADTDLISKRRLDIWLSKGEGEHSEYSMRGANDGVEYFHEVNGDIEKLKLSYEWKWLRERFSQKY